MKKKANKWKEKKCQQVNAIRACTHLQNNNYGRSREGGRIAFFVGDRKPIQTFSIAVVPFAE